MGSIGLRTRSRTTSAKVPGLPWHGLVGRPAGLLLIHASGISVPEAHEMTCDLTFFLVPEVRTQMSLELRAKLALF